MKRGHCGCDICAEKKNFREGLSKYKLIKSSAMPRHLRCAIDEWMALLKKYKKEIPSYIDREGPSHGYGPSSITTYYPAEVVQELWDTEKGKSGRCTHCGNVFTGIICRDCAEKGELFYDIYT